MSELLNLVGLITGIVLYAVLLGMVVRLNRGSANAPFDPLLLATAVLGLVWNLSALPAYELLWSAGGRMGLISGHSVNPGPPSNVAYPRQPQCTSS